MKNILALDIKEIIEFLTKFQLLRLPMNIYKDRSLYS